MDIEKLLGDRASENEEFTGLVTYPTQEELDQIYNFIKEFPNLMSIDDVPSNLLPLLAEYLGYTYVETEDEDTQREILKRLVQEYHRKGLPSQIEKAVNRGFSDEYVLGDLTYYNNGIDEGYSSMQATRDIMFRYDYSRWDWKRWPDNGLYREGVLEILASKFSEKTRESIEAVLPAGIKYEIEETRDIHECYLDYAYFLLDNIDIEIRLDIDIVYPYVEDKTIFSWDNSIADDSLYDGRRVVSSDVWEERDPQASIYNVLFPNNQMSFLFEVEDVKYSDNEDRMNGIIIGW